LQQQQYPPLTVSCNACKHTRVNQKPYR